MTLTKKILLYLLAGVVVAGVIYWYFYIRGRSDTNSNQAQKLETEEVVKKSACPLDGLSVPEAVANRHPLAIMIENHIDARPQVGLKDASLVYEAVTEGGITRWMAVFVWGEPEKVGPVRSARTYYLDWASEFNAFYAHAGGSVNALQKIPEYGILDLPHDKTAYWREPQAGKASEHTLFASTKKLWEQAVKNKWDMSGNYSSFEFKEDADKSLRPAAASLKINFSTPNYQVTWTYDPATNLYTRQQPKSPEIKTKNIVVQEVKRKIVTSGGKNVWEMTTIGSGKAKVLIDGKVIEGTWKKDSRTSRTWFYDSTGAKIKFNRGQTWIEIVHPELSVKAE